MPLTSEETIVAARRAREYPAGWGMSYFADEGYATSLSAFAADRIRRGAPLEHG